MTAGFSCHDKQWCVELSIIHLWTLLHVHEIYNAWNNVLHLLWIQIQHFFYSCSCPRTTHCAIVRYRYQTPDFVFCDIRANRSRSKKSDILAYLVERISVLHSVFIVWVFCQNARFVAILYSNNYCLMPFSIYRRAASHVHIDANTAHSVESSIAVCNFSVRERTCVVGRRTFFCFTRNTVSASLDFLTFGRINIWFLSFGLCVWYCWSHRLVTCSGVCFFGFLSLFLCCLFCTIFAFITA